MSYIRKVQVKGREYYQLRERFKKPDGTWGERVLEHIGNEEAAMKRQAELDKRQRQVAVLEGKVIKPATPDMPDGVYDVIYADPPWRYDFDVDSRATENHYPTLTINQICKLRDTKKVSIRAKFDTDAILYLWATAPKLNEALEVIRAWGFTYKSNMIWVKDKIGLGWYSRNQHELLLIAEKGNMPLPAANVRTSSVLNYPRTTHSTKPKEVYDLIETWYPDRRYLEVFGISNNRPKWAVFGNNIYD